jgi:Cof subfamily protein (haloacid dehalogenase superfamily)
MGKIKLIVTDLDGTFVVAGGQVPERNLEAVKAAQAQGIKVVACSARLWALGRHIVKKCGFDDIAILSGGATIVECSTGKLLYRKGIDPERYEELLKASISFGTMVQSWNHDFIGIYAPTMGERGINSVKNLTNPEALMHCEVRVYDTLENMVAGCRDKANQLLLYPGKEYVDAVRAEALKVCDVEVTSSSAMVVDITMPGVTKGAAARKLAEQLGIQSENIMAIGDSLSDADMLEFAGMKVAVGNAEDSLKQIAQHIVATNVDAGFAEAVYDLVLKS